MNDEINEGYIITDKISVGEIGFALGFHEQAPAPYVTWQHTVGKNDYIWGHYYSNRFTALEDLCERTTSEIRYQKQLAGIEDKKDLLPELCYCVLPSSGEPIIVRRDESGYYPFPYCELSDEEMRDFIDSQNAVLGVTKAQEAAMLHGSMFGWKSKGADPRSYDESGTPLLKRKGLER